jgi:simple sugar transport system substrate-binding protein
MEEIFMKRRKALKLFGAAAVAAAIGVAGISRLALAQDQKKKMVTVVKIAGIPWFNALENGAKKAGADFGIEASVVGPTHLDAAQQVKLLEDLVAQKVDVIGLVPIDVRWPSRC